MNRKDIAKMYHMENARGVPAPCFCPDFSEDEKLYKQIDSLNEVSIMQSESHLKGIVSVRLQERNVSNPFNGLPDDVIMENIVPSDVPDNELLGIAHNLEYEILHSDNDKK